MVCLLLPSAILFSLHSFSQKPQLRFEPVGDNSGLSESNVLCVIQDHTGFMWFGTADGLYKYDGITLTPYKNNRLDPKSISNNFILALMLGKTGDIWIGTLGSGVCRYDRRKEKFIVYKCNSEVHEGVVPDVNSLVEDSKGHIWIGTSDGLDELDPATGKYVHHRSENNSGISDNYIRDVFEDSDNNLWISTMKGGLSLFNSQTRTFTNFRHSRSDNSSISSDNISTVFEDSKKRIWIGTNEDGLDLYDRKFKMFYHFKHSALNGNSLSGNAITSITEDNEQKLWIATENAGLNIFDPNMGSFLRYTSNEFDNSSLGSNSVNTLYKDKKGNMWVGTFNAGINLVDVDAGKFKGYRHLPTLNSLSNNKVLCFFEDSKKNIWIGTDGGGLNLFDPRTGHFTLMRHENNNSNSIGGNNVLSVSEDVSGNIWIGTWGEGVTVYSPQSGKYKHYKHDPYNPKTLSNNNAWAIYRDKQNNMWIGTYGGGLNLYDPATNSFTSFQHDAKRPFSLSDNWVNSFYEDSDGNFWICTPGGGLNLMNRKEKTFTSFTHEDGKNSISDNSVNSIVEDRNKNLWITAWEGLNRFNKETGQFTIFNVNNGLPGNITYGALEDDKGHLWISTDKGLSCLDPQTLSFKNFTTSDGLQSDRFKEQAFLKSSSGMMYFGGNNGFNQFMPGLIKTMPFEAPVVITDFQLFNRRVAVGADENDPSPLKTSLEDTREIVLSWDQSFFSFGFASLDYSSPGRITYAYMLEGFDDSWNEVGNNHHATYTNLDPGTYTFKVKATNNDGTWSKKPATIRLTITPPFWVTWWFRISVGIVLAGSVAGVVYARVRAAKQQRKLLERKVKEQTIQLVHANEEERKARIDANHANEQLEKKNKELEQFAYIASHDLREPLRTTSGFVELLQKHYQGKTDDKAELYIKHINQGAARMRRLIDDLLDYSRINGQKQMEEVDCTTTLHEVTSDLEKFIGEAGATITAGQLPVIAGHPTGIKQLFQNLITNGIKFRKKDVTPTIHISAKECQDAWTFSFADNGIGIEQKHTERIFAIFERLHTRKEYEGTGIGLAHCKKIVELHKGKIWVESTPGTGSTFFFTINKNNIPCNKN